jgi:hypothetical protein
MATIAPSEEEQANAVLERLLYTLCDLFASIRNQMKVHASCKAFVCQRCCPLILQNHAVLQQYGLRVDPRAVSGQGCSETELRLSSGMTRNVC